MEQVNRLLTAALTNRRLEKMIEIIKEDENSQVKTFTDFQLVKTAILTVAIVIYKTTKIACLVVNKRVYFWRLDGKNTISNNTISKNTSSNNNISNNTINTTFFASYENFFYRAEYPALANLVYTCFYEGYIEKWLFHVKKPFSIYHVFADTLPFIDPLKKIDVEKFRRCIELFGKDDEDRYTSWEIIDMAPWDYIKDKHTIETYDTILQDQKEMWEMIVNENDYSCLERCKFRDLPYMLFCHALSSNDKKLEKYCLERWPVDRSRISHIKSFFT
uniref:Uncharacterized protein n=1 Tax=viral metagenome TaxID=1070528 RepID=A0A6C0JR21_9ZZZZ